MSDSINEECLKLLRGSLEAMPVVIRCSLLKPKASASDTLKWTGLAFRLVHGPLRRTATDLDRTNAREAADILREVVPQLEKIRNGHSSARLRQKADHYLRRIPTETDELHHSRDRSLMVDAPPIDPGTAPAKQRISKQRISKKVQTAMDALIAGDVETIKDAAGQESTPCFRSRTLPAGRE
jgi:hypothetical protein